MMSARPVAIALLLALGLPGAPSRAEEADAPTELEALREQRNEEIAHYGVRTLTTKRITAALEMLEAELYQEARDKLESLNFRRLNPYERAIIYRLIAYAAFGLHDVAAALDGFQKAVDEGALPIDDEAAVRFNIAQLHAAQEEWEQVIRALESWFPYVEEPNPLAYYLIAISYYQLERRAEALEPARRAVELSAEPREGWLQLLAALYVDQDDYPNAVPVLEQLVTRYPKKQYWLQLSLIYSAQGDYKPSLAVQQIAYAQGLLTEDQELRRLARTFLFQELPFPAAEVLEKGLAEGKIEEDVDVLELLSNSWIAAREYEKALAPLARAAELAPDGNLYLRLGRVHIQREQWDDAASALRRALDKGGLDEPGEAQLLLGISLYSADRPEAARPWFVRASQREASRVEANAWLEHLAREGHGVGAPEG